MLESLGKVVLTVGVTVNVVVQATCAPVGKKRRMRRICRAEIVDASSSKGRKSIFHYIQVHYTYYLHTSVY